MIRSALVFALATLATASTVPARAQEPAKPSFNGVWKLNASKSDDFQKKMQEMRGSGGGRGGMRGGHEGGMGGGPAGGGPGGRGEDGPPGDGWGGRAEGGAPGGPGGRGDGGPGAGAPRTNSLANPPLMLDVDQSDSVVVLSEQGRLVRDLWLLGSPHPRAQSDPREMRARWIGQRLQAESTGPRGGRLTEVYEISRDLQQLIVTIRLEGREGRPPLELKRVYDRYDGD